MAQMLLMNPRKRRASKKRTASRKRRTYKVSANPTTPVRRRRRRSTSATALVRRARRRVRRNPIGFNGIIGQIGDAAIGAGGAIGIDMLYNFLPIPATWKVGYTGIAAKAGIALLVGTFGKKVAGKYAEKAAAGALTVIAYDAIRSMIPPTVTTDAAVAGLGYAGAGYYGGQIANGIGEYVTGPDLSFASSGSGMGEYVYR